VCNNLKEIIPLTIIHPFIQKFIIKKENRILEQNTNVIITNKMLIVNKLKMSKMKRTNFVNDKDIDYKLTFQNFQNLL
jgi:hypothetical protein